MNKTFPKISAAVIMTCRYHMLVPSNGSVLSMCLSLSTGGRGMSTDKLQGEFILIPCIFHFIHHLYNIFFTVSHLNFLMQLHAEVR